MTCKIYSYGTRNDDGLAVDWWHKSRRAMSLLLLFNSPDYHDELIDIARQLIGLGHYQVAVVTAQMACEVCTEQAFAAILRKKNLAHLDDALKGMMRSRNLDDLRFRKLYEATSGDPIGQAPFWEEYTKAVDARNAAVHGGGEVTKEQAERALKAYSEVIDHVTKNANSL